MYDLDYALDEAIERVVHAAHGHPDSLYYRAFASLLNEVKWVWYEVRRDIDGTAGLSEDAKARLKLLTTPERVLSVAKKDGRMALAELFEALKNCGG